MGPSSSSKEFDYHDPYLVNLNLDEFIIDKPIIMNYDLDHEPLIKNNMINISAEENMLQRNPSSCSSSSSPPIIHENPLQEDLLQNPAPLMTKIDEEYMKWHQQGMVDSMQVETDLKVLENGFEKCADNSGFESDRNNECVERRQRRMIKNRESAARSRDRKQHKASQLQTSHNLLKKRKEACAIWNSSSISAPRYQLRRTSSAHF